MPSKPQIAGTAEIRATAAIVDVWSALGGAPLRQGRGRAFWRDGDGCSVSVDERRNLWHDFVTDEGGDVFTLVETVMKCSFADAARWLADFTGVARLPNHRNGNTDTSWRADLRMATFWSYTAVALAEASLEALPVDAPERRGLTQLLVCIRLGEASLVKEYRDWRAADRTFTAAMVKAGRASEERIQRRLALWIVEQAFRVA